jgi:hypothetical protein
VVYCQRKVRHVGTRTQSIHLGAVLAALAALCVYSPSPARSAPTVSLRAALRPERLGAGTTIKFGFTIATPAGQAPSPVTEIDLRYPANLGIGTSGLGLATCSPRTLEVLGPPGCPVNSVMGYGSAQVEVPFGPELLEETARTTTFMAPVQGGHLSLLFYADGETPVYAQLVFPGLVLPAPAPFGGTLDTALPLVPTVPGAADASIVKFSSTLGPSHVTYYEYARGKRIAYRPRGILLPRVCPSGGFQFAAELSFYDGREASAETTVPCPRSTKHRR